MKSNQVWLRFERKQCFGLKEARGRQNRVFEKLPLCAHLKTKNLLILQDSYSRSTCELLAKFLKCTGQVPRKVVSRKALVRESRNSLCKILEEMKIYFLIFATKVRGTLLATYLQKCFQRSFSKKHFQKLIKHSKIFLGLIIQQLSIHISHLNMYNHTNKIGIH